jgi:hypothetical protein
VTYVLIRPFLKSEVPGTPAWRARKSRWRCVFAGGLLEAIQRSELEDSPEFEVSVVAEQALTKLEIDLFQAQAKGVRQPVH